MSFSSAITHHDVWGSTAITKGTYTNAGGDTGGNIDTGLKLCQGLFLQPIGGAVNTNAPVVNETLPVAGSAVTIVTDDGADGIWTAFGDAWA